MDGALYGTTPNGGYAGAGVVFKLMFSATNDSNGLFQFQDAGAAKLAHRFYRAAKP